MFPPFDSLQPVECFCGGSEPTVKSTKCDIPCAGNDKVICGGRDLLTVFKRDGDDGGSGGTLDHIGCYEDDGNNRIMTGEMLESSTMTPKVTM